MKNIRELIDIMDGYDARKYWYHKQLHMKLQGDKYDRAIDDAEWLQRYLYGLCD